MIGRILWDEVCHGCGKRLWNNEIYLGLCANCQCDKPEQVKVDIQKIDIDKAVDEISLLPDLTMGDFIQNSVERNDFEWFKANKGFVVKYIDDLRKENEILKRENAELKAEVETLKSERTYKFYLGNDKVQDFKVSETLLKMIRTQVCEEIRDKQDIFTYKDLYDGRIRFMQQEFEEVIDQIEEGGV